MSQEILHPSANGRVTKPGRIFWMEGIRGLCAVSVLICHVAHDSTGFRTAHTSYFPGYAAAFFAYFGNIGVLLFFVLSGFVIGHTNREPFSWMEVKRYFTRRFIRIYPIYFAIIGFSFLVSTEPSDGLVKFCAHLIFLQTWVVSNVSTNGVLWTLHLEVAFYLLYLFVWRRESSIRVWFIGTAIAALASPFCGWHLLRVLGYFFLWLIGLGLAKSYAKCPEPIHAPETPEWRWFWASLFVSIAYTTTSAVEIIVGKYAISGKGYLSLVSVLMIAGCLRNLMAVPLGIKIGAWAKVMVAVPALASCAALGYALWRGLWCGFPSYQLTSAYLMLAVAGLVFGKRVQARVMLERCSWLGSISYALYMIQNPIEKLIYPYVPLSWPLGGWWAINLLIVLLTVLAAYLLELKYQPWCSRVLRARMINRQSSPIVPATTGK